MLRPSKLLSKSRYTQLYSARFRNFVRESDGDGVDTYTEKLVRMSVQPIDKANDELKNAADGERVQDKVVFYANTIFKAGDLFLFDGSWFRITKPNFRKPYGFSDGEGTRLDGPSGPGTAGFSIT